MLEKEKRFSPIHHIPKYSALLFNAIRTPLLIYLALVGNACTLVAAGLFYYFEAPLNQNVSTFFDALWWAMVTVTTVGYGDITPETIAGKLIGIFLIVIGVAFFLTFLAVLVTVLNTIISDKSASNVEIEKLNKRLDRIEELIGKQSGSSET